MVLLLYYNSGVMQNILGTSGFDLLTHQIYVVNKTRFQYVYVEIFNNATIKNSCLIKKFKWSKNDNLFFATQSSAFWKLAFNKLIDNGWIQTEHLKVKLAEWPFFTQYKFAGVICFKQLPTIFENEEQETDNMDKSIRYIESFIGI